MGLVGLIVSIALGVLLVLIWGLLSYVASDGPEFKSLFMGGLSNFVFFIGGVVSPYLLQFVNPRSSDTSVLTLTIPRGAGTFDVVSMLFVAIATMLALITPNLFLQGFTVSLARLEQLQSVIFTQDGIRDIQVFAAGSFGILSSLGALIYGLHLGSTRPSTTYLTVFVGVVLSIGVQGLLYVIFGAFFGYQALQLVNVSTPAILGTMGQAAQRFYGLALTAAVSFFLSISWTTAFWLSIKLGAFLSKFKTL